MCYEYDQKERIWWERSCAKQNFFKLSGFNDKILIVIVISIYADTWLTFIHRIFISNPLLLIYTIIINNHFAKSFQEQLTAGRSILQIAAINLFLKFEFQNLFSKNYRTKNNFFCLNFVQP